MGCSKCEGFVSDREYKYSIKNYGKVLCRDCQQDYVPLKNNYKKKRKKATPDAIKLHEILLKMGVNAKLEQFDGFKHIDIAIPDAKINLEIDGMQHTYSEKQALADLKRNYHSFKKGYVTLHIPNKLIRENAYETAKYLKKLIEESEEQLDAELNELEPWTCEQCGGKFDLTEKEEAELDKIGKIKVNCPYCFKQEVCGE